MESLSLISNLIESILLIIVALILLLVKSHDDAGMYYYQRAKRWLSFCIFMTGVSFFVELAANGFGGLVEILDIYNQMFFFVVSVSGQLALIHLYNSKKLSTTALVWVFMPVILLTAVYAVLVVTLGPGPEVYTFEEFLIHLPTSPILIFRVLILIAILVGIGTSVFRYFQARRAYRAMLDNYFSDDWEWRRTKWIDVCLYSVFVLVISTVISYLVDSYVYDLFFQLIVTACMLFLAIRVINYQGQFLRIAPAVAFAQTPPLTEADREFDSDFVMHGRREQWVLLADKPYLQPGLTLNDVSRMMGVSRHRLSSHLNQVLGLNFNAWIASLRIEEVMRQLSDVKNQKSLSEIAFKTGFADLAAMSNAFKKVTGISPSAYRRQISTQIHK